MKKIFTIITLVLLLLVLAGCGHEHTPAIDAAVAPTCIETGLTEGSHCSECGEVLVAQTEVAKAEHTAVVDKAIAATCTATGLTEGSHCSECGEVIVAQTEVAKAEHTAVIDEAVAATCTETGLTEGSHCSVCGEVLVAQTEIAKAEHTAVTIEAIAPTCAKEGATEGKKCSVCGEVLEAPTPIEKLAHTVVTTNAVKATCQTEGKTAGKHCSVCGEVLEAAKSLGLGDHFLGTVSGMPSTCTTHGTTSYQICDVCRQIIVPAAQLPLLSHTYLTTYTSINHTSTCTMCGHTDTVPHTLDANNKCSCGYTKVEGEVPVTKDFLTRIFELDSSVRSQMENYKEVGSKYSFSPYSKSYTGINSGWKMITGEWNTWVKDIAWLRTNGFVVAQLNYDAKNIDKYCIVLYSNTDDPAYMSPTIWRGVDALNRLYGTMYDETVATLDAFLNSIGEYEAVDYLINQKMQYVSQGGENAVAAFKQSMKEMATFIMGPAHAPTQLFKSSIQLKIKTSTCNYTITADRTYPYNINNTTAFLLKIQCERIRNDTLVTP